LNTACALMFPMHAWQLLPSSIMITASNPAFRSCRPRASYENVKSSRMLQLSCAPWRG
jgi:hypothetical protein